MPGVVDRNASPMQGFRARNTPIPIKGPAIPAAPARQQQPAPAPRPQQPPGPSQAEINERERLRAEAASRQQQQPASINQYFAAPAPSMAPLPPEPASPELPQQKAPSMQALMQQPSMDAGAGWAPVGNTELNPNLGKGQPPNRQSLRALAGMGQLY